MKRLVFVLFVLLVATPKAAVQEKPTPKTDVEKIVAFVKGEIAKPGAYRFPWGPGYSVPALSFTDSMLSAYYAVTFYAQTNELHIWVRTTNAGRIGPWRSFGDEGLDGEVDFGAIGDACNFLTREEQEYFRNPSYRDYSEIPPGGEEFRADWDMEYKIAQGAIKRQIK